MRRHRVEESKGEKAPIWILSFGDMITNFLAFFILMQSFSHSQRAELLQTGDMPLSSYLIDLGGAAQWLLGGKPRPEAKFRQLKYPVQIEADPDDPGRIIDGEDERLRKLFDDIRRFADTRTADMPQPLTRILTTPIRFGASQADLDPTAADYLVTLASEIGQDEQADRATVYVFATAPDVEGAKEQFILSALRAQAVRDCLARSLAEKPTAGGSRLLARGIGSGTRGIGPGAVTPPAVVIAVVEPARKE